MGQVGHLAARAQVDETRRTRHIHCRRERTAASCARVPRDRRDRRARDEHVNVGIALGPAEPAGPAEPRQAVLPGPGRAGQAAHDHKRKPLRSQPLLETGQHGGESRWCGPVAWRMLAWARD